MTGSFLAEPALTPRGQALYDEDLADDGFVWNASRLWAYQPESMDRLFDLMSEVFRASGLAFRQRAILVASTASTLGDSYCSLAWGGKLAGATDPHLAVAVLTGTDEGLTEQETVLASWARQIAKDPNATTPADIQRLREVGLTDPQVFAVTLFVSLRLAFSTVNDALGAHPDTKLVASLPAEIAAAVSYGRKSQD